MCSTTNGNDTEGFIDGRYRKSFDDMICFHIMSLGLSTLLVDPSFPLIQDEEDLKNTYLKIVDSAKGMEDNLDRKNWEVDTTDKKAIKDYEGMVNELKKFMTKTADKHNPSLNILTAQYAQIEKRNIKKIKELSKTMPPYKP